MDRVARDGHLDFHTAPELWHWASSTLLGLLWTVWPGTATSTFTQLLSSDTEQVQCCSDYYGPCGPGRPPRLSHSSWALTLSKFNVARTIMDRVAQDGHLDFHTAPELWHWASSMLLYVVVVVVDHFYIALISAFERTHWARMWFYMSD